MPEGDMSPGQDPKDREIDLDEWERMTAEKYGVPENLRRSILGQESADGTRLKSPTGVKGRYQVTEATAKQYGLDRNDQWQQPVAAMKHLRSLYDGVKKRNPNFSDKQTWLGASAEYYYGGDAFNKDGNLSTGSRDGYSTPAKYATSIAERWSAFDRDETPQPSLGTLPQYDEQDRRKLGARDVGITPAEGMRFDLSGGASRTTPKIAPQPPALRRLPRLSPERRQQQDKIITDVMRQNPGLTREQINEARRRLDSIPEAEFQTSVKGGDQPIKGKPFRRATLAETLQSQFEPDAGLTEADKRIQKRYEERMKMSLPRRAYEDFSEGGAEKISSLLDLASDTGEAASSALRGDFAPAKEVGREALARVRANLARLSRGGAAGMAAGEEYERLAKQREAEQSLKAEEVARQRVERQIAAGGEAGQAARIREQIRQQMRESSEATPDIGGRITRGVGSALSDPAMLAAPFGTRAMLGATALTQDYRDPMEAGLNIAGGAASIGAARGAARAVASRIAEKSPAQQTAAQMAAAVPVGSATNIGQEAVGQALRGKFDPQRLAEAGATGAILSTQDALEAGAARRRLARPEPLRGPTGRDATPLLRARPQEQATPRPGTEELTPEFRTAARRQALGLLGLKPEEIEAEIARRAPAPSASAQPAPLAQAARPVEGNRPPTPPALRPSGQPAPQPIEQPAPLSAAQQRVQERTRLYEVSRNVAGRSMEQAKAAMDAGDYKEAQAQVEASRRALRDQLRFASADAPGERARLAREITRAGAMLEEAKRSDRESARLRRRAENQPTRGIAAEPLSQRQARALSTPLLNVVVNPEGGVPPLPESRSGIFGRLARSQERGAGEPQDNIRINARIRQLGGINPAGQYTGDLQGAVDKRYPGLINRQKGIKPDTLREMLRDEGYPVGDDLDSLFRAIDDDVAGKEVYPLTRSRTAELEQEFADYYANQPSESLQTGRGMPMAGSTSKNLTTPAQSQRRMPPAPSLRRQPGQRVGVPDPLGRGRQSETGALNEVADFFGDMAREETPKTVTHRDPAINGKPVIAQTADGKVVVANPDNKSGVSVIKDQGETAATRGSLETAYRKLGTDNPAIISQLLRDSDKRFKRSATPDEMAAAQSAWAKVQRLTSDEQQALSQVIPQRAFAPVRSEYQGEPGERYGRSIGDITASEPNAQLDKNLSDLLGFFDDVTDKPKPKLVTDAAQRLKDAASGKLAGSGGRQLLDLTIVTGWKVYKAGQSFAEWSREVIKEAGGKVRPHLRRVWKELTENFSVGPLPKTRADVERSPRFQHWFKNSKVVDEDGKPLVVYHGTPSSFDTFDPAKIKQGGSLGPGVYIAENPYTANQYISGYNVGEDPSKSPNIMPLYLSMQKPLDVEAPLLDRAKVARLMSKEDAADLPNSEKVSYFEVIDAVGDKASQNVAKRLGYDGLVIDLNGDRVWLAFEPTQIKSATGNRGTFDTSSGSILGSGFGSLQPLFNRSKSPKPAQPTETGSRRGRASETVGGLQTAAQLGNPRFVIRNVLQHVAYGKQERGAMRLAATMDWAISRATGKGRQITAPGGSDLASYVRNWGKAVQAYKKGEPLPGKVNADYLTADGNKLDKAVGKVMTYINEIPDAANWQTRFESSLKSIVEASKRSKTAYDVDDMVDQAWMEANRAALRDRNFVSAAMLGIKQSLNKLSSPIFGTDKFGVGDFILKYAQTPGALLKRGLEHSPLGLFQVAREAAKPGPFRRRNTLLALSRVMTGTAESIGLGAALAAAGVLVGPEEEKRSGAAMEREEGVRGYSLNASALRRLLTGESTKMQKNDTLYSVDWLQPWAMGASAGAAVYNLHKSGKLGASSAAGATGEAIYNSLAKTLDVMGDQSVLKNLSRYMSRAQGEDFSDKMLSFAKEIGLDIPSSFVPSVARQARQVIDPFERDTRAEDRGGVRGFGSEAMNRALAQLPGASQRFPKRPSLLTGQDKKTPLGNFSVPARIAAQFSPANISTYAPAPVAREISRLNRAGEKVSVAFPRPLGEKEVGRRGYREPTSALRGRERQFAESFAEMSRELIGLPSYESTDDATKASAIKALAEHLRERTYKDIESRRAQDILDAVEAARSRQGRSSKNLLPAYRQ